jgi:antitoxin component YwqK of YwqJK toxin-antitoxin module
MLRVKTNRGARSAQFKGGNNMEWKLYDKDGNFLQEVNCQYDASDIATMMYNAKIIQLDFDKQEARIIE